MMLGAMYVLDMLWLAFGTDKNRVLPISLFIIAFTGAYANVHWMGMMVGGALFGFSMVSVYISANSVCVFIFASSGADNGSTL